MRAGLDIVCVPTSEATAAQAKGLGIPLTTLDETPELDLTIDGADEIGPGLEPDQGRRRRAAARKDRRRGQRADGGDRRRIASWCRRSARFPLPIEVNRFGLGATTLARRARRCAPCRAEGAAEAAARPPTASRSSPTAGTSSSMLFLAAFPSQKRFRPTCTTCRAWSSTGCS